jgi:hypothetical protein
MQLAKSPIRSNRMGSDLGSVVARISHRRTGQVKLDKALLSKFSLRTADKTSHSSKANNSGTNSMIYAM